MRNIAYPCDPGNSKAERDLLKNHFALYRGYVYNTNLLIELLGAYVKGGQFDYQYQTFAETAQD